MKICGTFFLLSMFVVPIIAAVGLIHGFLEMFGNMPKQLWILTGLASLLSGIGIMLRSKAIAYIGLFFCAFPSLSEPQSDLS